jgi:hypothetical protein
MIHPMQCARERIPHNPGMQCDQKQSIHSYGVRQPLKAESLANADGLP